MIENRKLIKIFELLKKLYPDPKTELDYSTPFQLMVAVILSAQTTDKQVNKMTKNLFMKVKKPGDLLKFGVDVFEKSISGVNYYKTKAKNIWKLATLLDKAPLPSFLEGDKAIYELMKLPGIGVKSAKVIGHVLWDLPVIAVDTHVHRVVNRRGIVHAKTPNETSEILEKIVPKKYKDFAHHAIVLFGRYVCTARNPHCPECLLKRYCEYYHDVFLSR